MAQTDFRIQSQYSTVYVPQLFFACLSVINQVNSYIGFKAVSNWTKCIKCKLIFEELNFEQAEVESVANTSEIRRKATNEGVFIFNVQIYTY